MRLFAIAAIFVLAGCAGSQKPLTDPLAVVNDTEAHVNERVRALDDVANAAEAGSISNDTLRSECKNLLWDTNEPTRLRVAAYRTLMSDTSADSLADMQRFSALRLPTEPTADLVAEICEATTEHGWTSMTSSLVRSFARPGKEAEDKNRAERATLVALHPDERIERIAFEVFLDPQVVDGEGAAQRRSRARADAWSLLARLDPEGEDRLAWIQEGDAGADAEVVQWCADELHTIPITGLELQRLDRMAETRRDPEGWWRRTQETLGGLTEAQLHGLRLRHLAPINWAASHRSDLLMQSRAQLLDELREMDASRPHYRRTNMTSTWGPTRDRLKEWESELTWGDMLTILVIDEALHRPEVVELLFGQATMDHADKTSEYGGTLELDGDAFIAHLYPPRPMSRVGDFQFIAPADMIDQSTYALAHYHFHVQQWRNAKYAGPSQDDQVYATEHGRNCIIFTSIEEGVMNVDVLMPHKVTIDIGVIRR